MITTQTGTFVLIAEGGGWPTHAIGPFGTDADAERFIARDKWRESWGSIADNPRDLPVIAPEDDRLTLVQTPDTGEEWFVLNPGDPFIVQGWDEHACLPERDQRYDLRFASVDEAATFARNALGWEHGVVIDSRPEAEARPENGDIAW